MCHAVGKDLATARRTTVTRPKESGDRYVTKPRYVTPSALGHNLSRHTICSLPARCHFDDYLFIIP